MRISDFVDATNVMLGLEGATMSHVLEEMVSSLDDKGMLGDATPKDVLSKLLAREKQGSTGFGGGVALPHVKLDSLAGTVIVIGRSEAGVDFSANDGEKVHTIFLILSSSEDAETHLQTLKWVVRIARDRYYSKLLRGSRTVEHIVELFGEFDDATANQA